eukprot:s112_g49.t1
MPCLWCQRLSTAIGILRAFALTLIYIAAAQVCVLSKVQCKASAASAKCQSRIGGNVPYVPLYILLYILVSYVSSLMSFLLRNNIRNSVNVSRDGHPWNPAPGVQGCKRQILPILPLQDQNSTGPSPKAFSKPGIS